MTGWQRGLTGPRAASLLAVLAALYHLYSEVHGQLGGAPTFHQRLELTALDAKLAARGSRPPARWGVAIAGADELSLRKFGPLPWSRRVHAELVEALTRAGASAIAFDMTFEQRARGAEGDDLPERLREALDALETGEPNAQSRSVARRLREMVETLEGEDDRFAQAIRRSERVVLGVVALTAEEAVSLGDPEEGLTDSLRKARPALIDRLVEVRPDGLELVRPVEGAFRSGPYRRYFGLAVPTATLTAAAISFGALNSSPDIDGVNRSLPLVVAFKDRDVLLPTLSLAAVAVARASSVEILGHPDEAVATHLRVGSTRASVGIEGRGFIEWYGESFRSGLPQLSIAEIIEGTVPEEEIRGRVIFVAATAVGTYDQRVTPLERAVPGVHIHAALAQNLLDGRGLRRPGEVILLELVMITLVGLLFGLRRGPRIAIRVLLGGLLVLGWNVADQGYLLGQGWIVHTVLPTVQFILTVLAVSLLGFLAEARERRRTRAAFQRYLSPKVMEQVLSDPDRYLRLGGQRYEATVLFSDIRGFTSISEGLDPEELGRLLNLYMTPMTRVVFEYDGTLDKYIGDAVMALWGAPVTQPTHAVRACRAALAMLEALERVNAELVDRGLPELSIGIGLSTGEMTIGNMGSEDFFAYTAIGDRVNLGARLEGQTKNYGVDVIISEATYQAVSSEMLCRELDLLRVKGKREPERIYELVGARTQNTDRLLFVEIFESGLEAFRTRRFGEARVLFEEADAVKPDGDRCARQYRDLSAQLELEPPPPDWDGVRDATTK